MASPTFNELSVAPNAVVWKMSLTGEIVEISDSIMAVRGYTPAEACAQGGDEILTQESLAVSLRYFEKFSLEILNDQTPEPFRVDMEYKCKDGSTVWCDVYVEPEFSETGEVLSLIGISTPLPTSSH